jgi:hypothetical protein
VNWSISDADGVIESGTADVDADGNWSATPTGSYAEGVDYTANADISVTVTETDSDGDTDTDTATASASDTAGFVDTTPTAEGAQNTVIANGDADVEADVTATASLNIDWEADGYDATSGSIEATTYVAESTYVTAVASNGDTLEVTSDGTKLVYVEGDDGTLYAVKEGSDFDLETGNTDGLVFSVAVDDTGSNYTTTMYDSVDAYTVESDPVEISNTTETIQLEGETKPDDRTATFTTDDKVSGGNSETLVLSQTDDNGTVDDTSDDVTITLTFTATDAGETDTVNSSGQRIGVGTGQTIDEDDALTMTVSATDSDGSDINVTMTGVTLTTDQLEQGKTTGQTTTNDEVAVATVNDGSNTEFTVSGSTQGASGSSDETLLVGTASDPSYEGSFDSVTFTSQDSNTDKSDDYGILLGDGIVVDYTVDVPIEATETTVVTETTTTSYDYTIEYTFTGTDGDGDETTTDFHVTFDANDDGVMYSVDSDEAVAVVETTTETEVTTTLVDLADEVYLSDGHALEGDGTDTVTTEETATSEETVTGTASNVTDGTYTDDDVMVGDEADNILVGGDGNDILVGGDGSDELFGGAGDDTLDGEAGQDQLTGGTGDDVFIISSDDAVDVVLDMDADNSTVEDDELVLSDVLTDTDTVEQQVIDAAFADPDTDEDDVQVSVNDGSNTTDVAVVINTTPNQLVDDITPTQPTNPDAS